jgi:hypothetical protein
MTCTSCGGTGGRTVTTYEASGGKTVTRSTWHSCSPCRGSGQR